MQDEYNLDGGPVSGAGSGGHQPFDVSVSGGDLKEPIRVTGSACQTRPSNVSQLGFVVTNNMRLRVSTSTTWPDELVQELYEGQRDERCGVLDDRGCRRARRGDVPDPHCEQTSYMAVKKLLVTE